jgi:glutamine amidotransferase PdxT
MSSWLDKLSLAKQFILIFLAALALMGTGTGMALLHSYNLHLNSKKQELQDILDTTRSITNYYAAQAQSGAMTTQEAQTKALAAISSPLARMARCSPSPTRR